MSKIEVISIDSSDEDEVRAIDKRKESINKLYPKKELKAITQPKLISNGIIGGVNVSFPVKPYTCQVALASTIISTIKKSENCILESPTGSGKTLALLCAALAWQQHEKKQLATAEASKAATPKKIGTNKVSSSGLVNIHKRPRNEDVQWDDEDMFNIDDILFDFDEIENKVPKIYYGSRTHSQLKQVIEEFKRTPYCAKDMTQMAILSARNKSCIRERDTAQWQTVDDMCRKCTKAKKENPAETNCTYFDNRKNLPAYMLSKYAAFDLEDLVTEGRWTRACPYYGARELAKTADIIFCPYNYLIDPNIRERLNINLKNNVVIIDEAHNIENICRDVRTFEIRSDQLDKTKKELETLNPGYVDILKKVLVNWKRWFENHAAQASNREFLDKWQTEHFIESLKNHNISQEVCSAFAQNASKLCERYQNQPESLFGVSDITIGFLQTIVTALQYIFEHGTDYKPALSSQDGILILKLECLNPSLAMDSIKEARSLILASGTLSPMDSLPSELGTRFLHKLSLKHCIPKERVWIGALCHDGRGQPLRCTSGAGGASTNAPALGRVLVSVCRITPHAVVVVLPSYKLLNDLLIKWRTRERVGYKSIWEELKDLKHVMFESKNSDDHEEVMKEFLEHAPTERGALLFAIHRGKVSEGMDLRDRQARCVVCIGIPYPNLVEVKAKRDYNDKYARDPIRKLLNGSHWYDVQAYRALNQAVGRCVRHRDDWGAVLLVDSRFAEERPRHNLAKWVQDYMDVEPHSPESLVSNDERSLKSFMERMQLKEVEESSGRERAQTGFRR